MSEESRSDQILVAAFDGVMGILTHAEVTAFKQIVTARSQPFIEARNALWKLAQGDGDVPVSGCCRRAPSLA